MIKVCVTVNFISILLLRTGLSFQNSDIFNVRLGLQFRFALPCQISLKSVKRFRHDLTFFQTAILNLKKLKFLATDWELK